MRWVDRQIRTHPRLIALAIALLILAFAPDRLAHAAPFLVIGAIQLDDVNTVTTKEIMPGVVDGYFKAGPVIAMAKARFTRKWVGPQIQENFMYKPMRGGAYKKGATFDVSRMQTRTGMLFTPRYYQVNVTEFLEDLEVEMVGPRAAFNVIRTDMQQASLTMSAILEIASMQHGQALPGDDRSAELNGFAEALNDGINASWDGNIYPSYGGQTRADVAPALTTPTGLVAANVNGPISYRILRHSYFSCILGNEAPGVGITTNRCMGFIAENFLPHQIVDTTQPEINWPGLKFDKATILMSQYAPGQDGVNDPFLGNYNAAAETFFWLNFGPQGDDAYIRLYIAQSSKFAFGFTGFKGAREDNQVSGQILFAGNLTVKALRLSRGLRGITS
jgi:subtilisin family serine protease